MGGSLLRPVPARVRWQLLDPDPCLHTTKYLSPIFRCDKETNTETNTNMHCLRSPRFFAHPSFSCCWGISFQIRCNEISFMQQNLIPEKMQLDLVFGLVPKVLEILTQLNLLDYYAITNFKYM